MAIGGNLGSLAGSSIASVHTGSNNLNVTNQQTATSSSNVTYGNGSISVSSSNISIATSSFSPNIWSQCNINIQGKNQPMVDFGHDHIVRFYNKKGTQVGSIDLNGEELEIKGNLSEAAEIFSETLSNIYNMPLIINNEKTKQINSIKITV